MAIEPDNITTHNVTPLRRANRLEWLRNAAAAVLARVITKQQQRPDFLTPAKPWPGVLPKGITHNAILAMDDGENYYGSGFSGSDFGYNSAALGLYGQEGLGFLGYGVLAELTQRTEYRRLAEILSEEMVRKFLRITSASKDDQNTRIRLVNDAMEKFHLRKVFRRLAEVDACFGRAHLYIDVGKISDEEKASPLLLTPETFKLHALRGLKVIEPFWCYPAQFNGSDPTDNNFYRPEHWYVMGKKYHRTRLIPFVNRPVPDILKPAFSFGGMPAIQMAKPYIDNFVRTRQNVAQLIETFAQVVMMTNLDSTMNEQAAAEVDMRAELFNLLKTNRGVMLLDKDTEDLKVVATPLSGLDQLQAQSLEFICSSVAVPLVKYTGIQPAGLNASSDGEIRTFYDATEASRSRFFDHEIPGILDLLMLSELGKINKDISFAWEPLWQTSDTEQATIRKTNADTAQVYISAGVLDPQEERERLANEETGLYVGIDPDQLPKPPAQEGVQNADPSHDPLEDNMDLDKAQAQEDDGMPAATKPGAAPVPNVKPAEDAAPEFKEDDHPRDEGGKFAKSNAMKTALHPDNFDRDRTKQLLNKVHKRVEQAHAHRDSNRPEMMRQLEDIKHKNRNYSIVGKYIDQLIADHNSGEKDVAPPPPVPPPAPPPPVPPPAPPKVQTPKQFKLKDPFDLNRQLETNDPTGQNGKYYSIEELSNMSTGDFRAKFGMRVASKSQPGDTPNDLDNCKTITMRARHAISKLPAEHRSLLQHVPVDIVSMIDLGTSQTTTGLTGKNEAAGLYRSGQRPEIEIAATYKNGEKTRGQSASSAEKVTIHEIGHAIDHRFFFSSFDKEFISSIPPPGERGGPEKEKMSRYFHLNTGETFAELYAVMHAPDAGDPVFFHCLTKEEAMKIYAKPIAYIQGKLDRSVKKEKPVAYI